ncbi:MAG: hypothetical protein MUF83_19845 [Acidimicrobiales bacterium]|nr:hypothetical protein [Acidimicrobiales bacterium]
MAQAQEFLPQMSYPAVVEQGQTFTLSGTDCVGRVAGSFEDGSDWSDLDLVANGSWSVELTVAADAPIGEFDWDMQCINDAGNPRYPFSSMEIVPAGTLETTTTTTTTTVTPTSPVPTSAAAPTTAKARPTTALPSYTG